MHQGASTISWCSLCLGRRQLSYIEFSTMSITICQISKWTSSLVWNHLSARFPKQDHRGGSHYSNFNRKVVSRNLFIHYKSALLTLSQRCICAKWDHTHADAWDRCSKTTDKSMNNKSFLKNLANNSYIGSVAKQLSTKHKSGYTT